LPNPPGRLGRIVRERVVDAKSTANHELVIGDVVWLAGRELLKLCVHIQRTYGDVDGLAFGRTARYFDRPRGAKRDDVRLGGGTNEHGKKA
jgi:hypothetical protein